jgi:hypothetical protein
MRLVVGHRLLHLQFGSSCPAYSVNPCLSSGPTIVFCSPLLHHFSVRHAVISCPSLGVVLVVRCIALQPFHFRFKFHFERLLGMSLKWCFWKLFAINVKFTWSNENDWKFALRIWKSPNLVNLFLSQIVYWRMYSILVFDLDDQNFGSFSINCKDVYVQNVLFVFHRFLQWINWIYVEWPTNLQKMT